MSIEADIPISTGSEALDKASCDHFDFAIKLVTGEIICFESLDILNDKWVHLNGIRKDFHEQPQNTLIPFLASRGMDIRIEHIVWVMDAPNGS